MKFSFHHVALSVSNRDKSVQFYSQLGFSEFHRWTADDGSLTITHLSKDGMFLELFCFADNHPAPESIHSTETDLPVIGTKHFGLRVESIEAAREELVKKQLLASDTVIRQGRTGPRYFFIEDPDGILIEIAEDSREF